MTILGKIAALTVAAATLTGAVNDAFAESGSAPMYVTNNVKGRALWISIGGDAFGSYVIARVCVLPYTTWKSDNINLYRVTNVYMRAELKDYGNNCNTQHNRFDAKGIMMTINSNGRSMVTFTSDNIDVAPSINTTLWH